MESLTTTQNQNNFGCNINELLGRSPLELLFCILYFIICITVAACGLQIYSRKKNGHDSTNERIGHDDNQQIIIKA